MNVAVRYYTKSGNTKKLADAIAEEIGVSSESITTPLSEKVDILLLGCSYYAFDMDSEVKEFIKNNKDNISEIVCFGTSAMMKSMLKPLRKVTSELGVKVSDKEFHCHGSFGVMHKGKPDDADVKNAKEFARSIIK